MATSQMSQLCNRCGGGGASAVLPTPGGAWQKWLTLGYSKLGGKKFPRLSVKIGVFPPQHAGKENTYHRSISMQRCKNGGCVPGGPQTWPPFAPPTSGVSTSRLHCVMLTPRGVKRNGFVTYDMAALQRFSNHFGSPLASSPLRFVHPPDW